SYSPPASSGFPAAAALSPAPNVRREPSRRKRPHAKALFRNRTVALTGSFFRGLDEYFCRFRRALRSLPSFVNSLRLLAMRQTFRRFSTEGSNSNDRGFC